MERMNCLNCGLIAYDNLIKRGKVCHCANCDSKVVLWADISAKARKKVKVTK